MLGREYPLFASLEVGAKLVTSQLRAAREELRELIDRQSGEAAFQKFFAENSFVLSRGLPLALRACDVKPLGRPGRSEPDFVLFPGSNRSHQIHGLVELKRPDTPVLLRPRRTVLSLSRDVRTAADQLLTYDEEYDRFSPVSRSMAFLSSSYLFIIAGMSKDISSRALEFPQQIRRLLPNNMRLIAFDELLEQFESTIPPVTMILVCENNDTHLADSQSRRGQKALITVDEFRDGLSVLSSSDREAFLLMRLSCFSANEASEIIDCGVPEVRVRVNRAEKALKDYFGVAVPRDVYSFVMGLERHG